MRACRQPRAGRSVTRATHPIGFWAVLLLLCGGAGAQDAFFYGGPDGHTRLPLIQDPNWSVALVEPGTRAADVVGSLREAGITVPVGQVGVLNAAPVAIVPAGGRQDAVERAIDRRVGDGVILAGYRVFAGPGGAPWVESDRLVVRPAPGVNRQALWQQFDLEVIDQLGLASATFVCRARHPEERSTVDIANDIVEQDLAEFAHADFVVQVRYRQASPQGAGRFTETDPLFAQQWHLDNTGQGGGVVGADVRASTAWDLARGNPRAVVCIYDSGTDVDHEDLDTLLSDGSPKVHSQYDIVSGTEDARPNTEPHGTACAGVAVSAGLNGLGGAGVAPDCALMAVKIGDSFGASIAQFADGYIFARDRGAWVVSQSFGLGLSTGTFPVLDDAVTSFATTGRNGLGGILLAASGNGNSGTEVDNGEADTGFPEDHPDVWPVGASTNEDLHSPYSDTGSRLIFVAPSNGGTLGITTTDISGAAGYTSGDYTNDFGGTSSACPLAAGITALVWGVVPQLPPTPILQMLTGTADKIGNLPYPGGRNNVYGYGRLNASSAMTLAVSLIGTDVDLTVATVNGAAGTPLSATKPVPVTYTDSLDNPRTAFVYDGVTVTITVKDGTAVTFPAQVDDGSNSRYVCENPPSQVITGPVAMHGDYFHQLRRTFGVATQSGSGVSPILFEDSNTVDLTVTQTRAGDPPVVVNAQVPPGPGQPTLQLWADAGSTYAFGTETSASDNEERWITQTAKTGAFALNDPNPTATFFHQSRPRVRLVGTNSQSTVDTERRTLFGVEQPNNDLFGTFNEFCDNGSRLGFTPETESLGDEPVRGTTDVREFPVATGLDTSVTYIAEARTEQSKVIVENPRVAANGRTEAIVEIRIRDSQGNILDTPIDATRVGLIPNPTDGVQIITPTGQTDENGVLTFRVTRNLPGDVKLTGTVDGKAIPADNDTFPSDVINFLRVMTVPLPVAGTYFLTFPITPDGDITPEPQTRAVGDPDNSLEQIRTFDVVPQPAQMARLVDGTDTYVLFGELENLSTTNPNYDRFRELYRIEPGRGFFLRTNQPGNAELVGEWSTGSEYSFPMAEAGFHQLGNPQADAPLFWSLSDIDVWENGQLVGPLDELIAAVSADPSAPRYVDPFGWAYTGSQYEQVTDPTIPGTEGLKTQLAVFEGFFQRSYRPGLELKLYPGRSRHGAPRPISPSNFGVQLKATVGEASATAIVGSYGRGLRTAAAPPSPDGAEPVRLEILTPQGGRAAGDWIGQPVSAPTEWVIAVTTPGGPSDVTLSWPHLNRQLPRGYRVKVTDPTSGRTQLMNTSSSLVFSTTRAGEARQFTVTVVPRTEAGLRILRFEPGVSRGRQVTFQVDMVGEADLQLVVASPSGRAIAQTRTSRAAGTTSLTWNGLDAAGRPVPQGLYHVTLVARGTDGEVRREMRILRVR